MDRPRETQTQQEAAKSTFRVSTCVQLADQDICHGLAVADCCITHVHIVTSVLLLRTCMLHRAYVTAFTRLNIDLKRQTVVCCTTHVQVPLPELTSHLPAGATRIGPMHCQPPAPCYIVRL